jgi:hypothetical protein
MTQVVITAPAVSVVEINTGTQGPAGPAGATGPAGPAGATGANGATGAQGPAGTADGPMTVVDSGILPSAPSAGTTQLTPIEYVPGWRDLLMMDEDSSVSFVRRWMRGASEFAWAPAIGAQDFMCLMNVGLGMQMARYGAYQTFVNLGLDATTLGYRRRYRCRSDGTVNGTQHGFYSALSASSGTVTSQVTLPSRDVSGTRYGGYYFFMEFAWETDFSNVSAFAGVGQDTPGGSSSPITRAHHAGVSWEPGSATGSAMRFTRNDGSASGTAVDLTVGQSGVLNSLNRGTYQPIQLTLFSPPEADALGVRIDLVTAPRSITPIYRALHTTGIPTTPTNGQVIEVLQRNGSPFAGGQSLTSIYRIHGWQGG